jgi:hypothetical protein
MYFMINQKEVGTCVNQLIAGLEGLMSFSIKIPLIGIQFI